MNTNTILFALDLSNPFIKLLLPSVGIAAIILLCKSKLKLSLQHDLMLVAPPLKGLMLWVIIGLGWMLATDFIMNWRGTFDFTIWREQPWYASALRIAAVCFAGPILEELIFRGLLFRKLSARFPALPWIAVVVLAAVWSVIHYSYSPAEIFIIFIEGVLLGAALLKTKSLYVPIAMHICWNLYAIW